MRAIIFFIGIFISTIAISTTNLDKKSISEINLENLNKQFDKISLSLSTQNLDLKNLSKARDSVRSLQEKARDLL